MDALRLEQTLHSAFICLTERVRCVYVCVWTGHILNQSNENVKCEVCVGLDLDLHLTRLSPELYTGKAVRHFPH